MLHDGNRSKVQSDHRGTSIGEVSRDGRKRANTISYKGLDAANLMAKGKLKLLHRTGPLTGVLHCHMFFTGKDSYYRAGLSLLRRERILSSWRAVSCVACSVRARSVSLRIPKTVGRVKRLFE